MKATRVAWKVREQMEKFLGIFYPQFSKPQRRFIGEMLFGIQAAQEVKLSAISRRLGEATSLKKTEERLSRHLGVKGLGQRISERLAREGAQRVGRDTLLVVDLTDIRKGYARRMPYLDRVRDGSTGQLVRGYWSAVALACEVEGRTVVPLHQRLWSAQAPDFVSENAELLDLIGTIAAATEGRGIYVMDRGADRGNLFNALLNRQLRFIIRLRGDRLLLYRGRMVLARDLVRRCPMRYAERIVRETPDGETSYRIQYGSVRVRWPASGAGLTLVVVVGFGAEPVLLLTNVDVTDSRKSVWFVVRAYLQRWLVEETIRFLKQSYRLEEVRLLDYERLRNLFALVIAAAYFSAVWLGRSLKLAVLTHHITEASKRFFGVVEFHYYALADGIAHLLTRLGSWFHSPPSRSLPSEDSQLPLPGFS